MRRWEDAGGQGLAAFQGRFLEELLRCGARVRAGEGTRRAGTSWCSLQGCWGTGGCCACVACAAVQETAGGGQLVDQLVEHRQCRMQCIMQRCLRGAWMVIGLESGLALLGAACRRTVLCTCAPYFVVRSGLDLTVRDWCGDRCCTPAHPKAVPSNRHWQLLAEWRSVQYLRGGRGHNTHRCCANARQLAKGP